MQISQNLLTSKTKPGQQYTIHDKGLNAPPPPPKMNIVNAFTLKLKFVEIYYTKLDFQFGLDAFYMYINVRI